MYSLEVDIAQKLKIETRFSVQISAWGGIVPPQMGWDKGPMGGDWRVIRDKSGR